MNVKYHADAVEYKIVDSKKIIVISGWYYSKFDGDVKLAAKVNSKEHPLRINRRKRMDVNEKLGLNKSSDLGFEAFMQFDEDVEEKDIKSIELLLTNKKEEKVIFKLGEKRIQKVMKVYNESMNHIVYSIDNTIADATYITLMGWAVNVFSDDAIDIKIFDDMGNEIESELIRTERKDVIESVSKNNKNFIRGYNISFKYNYKKNYYIYYKSADSIIKKKLNIENIIKQAAKKKNKKKINKKQFVKRLGVKKTIEATKILLNEGPLVFYEKYALDLNTNRNEEYAKWVKKHFVKKEELEMQSMVKFEYEPLISIAIPLYKTDKTFLDDLLDSILGQSYKNFELCLADASDTDELKGYIEEKYPDERIIYKKLESNAGISENTNEALDMTHGDYIMFSDHDDVLCKNALYEMVKAINKDRTIDALYTDEDKINFKNDKYFEPHFKPDFSIDLLTAVNYICHIFMVRRDLYEKVGNLNKDFDGAQDYDFVLRCCEQAKNIHHIPMILYHWRCHEKSTAANPKSKMYAFEAGKRAIDAHYKRVGIDGEAEITKNYGIYRSRIKIKDNPLVSILIPNKDHIDDLDKCLKSVIKKSTYKNYEIIVIENNSTEPATFEYYKKLEKVEKCKVVYWKDEFNYAAINNFGAKAASGSYYILLNNDTEIIAKNWIEEMLSYCQRDDVGIVGARLYYPDDVIQHAGVILGFGGIAGHAGIGQSRYELGYMGRTETVQDMSAVTAACLMVKKSVFDEVEGLDETFKVAFNDVDFCMKVRDKGYLIVYNPYVELYHYESKSRGYEDNPEKIERFNSEIRRFREKWGKELEIGDPFYNKNLSLNKADYSLREENEKLA
ncbi:Glycosyltransferase, GT2 family [Lachnospiraceae bacterium RM5]|nr:Glycosyltransferase, GT2 family [Lachnospiraceae bacterium RM5]